MTTLWILGEMRDGALKRVSEELVTAARDASPDSKLYMVLVGGGLQAAVERSASLAVDGVLAVEDERLTSYSPDGWAGALAEVARERQPDVILGPATTRGRELAARLAAELDVAVVSDAVEITIGDGSLEALRPIYAGRALARVRASGRPLVATLRPNSYPAAEPQGAGAPVERVTPGDYVPRAVVTETAKAATARPDVSEADVIVSGGRGMGGPEHFALLEALADEMGAAVGASRAVVDAGWRPHREQVGQTGKTVSPSLYIACGISGAVQHLAGMKTSKVIVAVNKDAEAPIFAVADYGIVGDVFEAVPAITAAVREQRQS